MTPHSKMISAAALVLMFAVLLLPVRANEATNAMAIADGSKSFAERLNALGDLGLPREQIPFRSVENTGTNALEWTGLVASALNEYLDSPSTNHSKRADRSQVGAHLIASGARSAQFVRPQKEL